MELNARERFLAVMRGEPVDRTLIWECGYWVGAKRRWYGEGLPQTEHIPDDLPEGQLQVGEHLADPTSSLPPDRDVRTYFGFDEGTLRIPVKTYLYPGYKTEILEDHGDWVLQRSGNGIVERVENVSTTRSYVHGPVASREDWEQIKAERLQPTLKGRLPDDWAAWVERFRRRTFPLAVGLGGGFFGTPRYLLGTEQVLTCYYDNPDLMRDMVAYLADFWIALFDQVLDQIDADCVHFWEDMCYKTGPLISPRLFREFMLPAYKKMTAFFRDRGIDVLLVDTDGNCEQLIQPFVEGGITGIYPFEVASDNDVLAVREAFPRLGILSAMDKRAIAAGPAEIDAHLGSRVPQLLESGGFIPFVDHQVPPDVSWANFVYYRERLTAMIRSVSASS